MAIQITEPTVPEEQTVSPRSSIDEILSARIDSNHLFSTEVMTDDAGSLIETYDYDSHGKMTIKDSLGVVQAASAVGNVYGFTGRRLDLESGLYYFRARYFDVELGRFIGRDPLGYVDGFGLYGGYFIPNKQDPLGLWGEGGHFFTTYLIAIMTGKYTRAEAFSLAYYSQLPDETITYDAMSGWFPNILTGNRFVERYLHSLHGGDSGEWQGALKCLLKSGNLEDWEKGVVIHALGDAYAHSYDSNGDGSDDKSYGWPAGHTTSGHEPDRIPSHFNAYSNYVKNLYTSLGGDPNQMGKVNTFLNDMSVDFPSNISDLSSRDKNDWNNFVTTQVRDYKGGYSKNEFSYTDYRGKARHYDPLGGKHTIPGMRVRRGDMNKLIEKIKNAVENYKEGGCCESEGE